MPDRDVLVIDVGKTHLKLVRIGPDLAVQSREVTSTPRKRVPYLSLDHDAALNWIARAAAGLPDRDRIGHIAPIAHGAAFAILDEQGLVLPVMDYEHTIPPGDTAAYDAVRPAFAETFSPRLANGLNAGRQLAHLSHAFPREWARVRSVLALPQFIGWALTGHQASEVSSLGCHTDLWRPTDGTFSSLAEAQGWAALFPPIRPAGAILGTLSRRWRDLTGLPADAVVHVGAHDSNADLYAAAGRRGDRAVLSTGTWIVAMTPDGDLSRLDETRDCLANVSVEGAPVPSARFEGGRLYERMVAGDGDDPGRVQVAAERCAVLSVECLQLTGVRPVLAVSGPFASNQTFLESLASALPAVRILAGQKNWGAAMGAAALTLGINRPMH